METPHVVLSDDFSSFPLGPFPYDPDHSAMGEYHFCMEEGYKGQWFDPIANWEYKGPSWLVTAPLMDGSRCMEQMRVTKPMEKAAVPVLRAGAVDWADYTVSVALRALTAQEICGVLFRYQTSMMHYGFFLVPGGVELHRVDKLERTVLASARTDWGCDDFHTLTVGIRGDSFTCFLDGRKVLEAADTRYGNGCVALCACMPTQYRSISVQMDNAAYDRLMVLRDKEKHLLARRKEVYPRPVLYKSIDLQDFGAGRQLRFGHLTGTEELFFIICQHQRRVFKDRYPFISCMTAVSLESGEVLWQIGEPRDDEDVIGLTTDLPFQIYDIDGDGIDEVITSWNFTIFILDGRTGKVKKSIPTPGNVEPPQDVCGLEFGRYAFERLNVDAIRIVNVSGNARPSDILVKDRYSRLWVYDRDLNLKWKFSKYNTGHFPYGYDIDGDGKDEIFSCYNMVDDDGGLLWSLPMDRDHTDEIIIGKMDPDREEFLAIVSGWEGFMLVDKRGNILVRDVNGHGQRISTGNYCPERSGLEICTTTYWGNNGIVYMYDCKGRELWHREMLCNGNVIAPVNWNGSGADLILLNGDCAHGGLIDGDGRVVVSFPDDGHPVLCAEVLDVTGDARDEIILWDRKRLWVYTQDRPVALSAKGEYLPHKYPMYNASNYRGEFSFPNWIKK